MGNWLKIALIFCFAIFFFKNAEPQPYTKTRILFVLDGSYSMYGNLDKNSKISVAKQLLSRMVDSLSQEKHVEIGLRAYGHQSNKYKQDCKDTRLEVGFRPKNEEAIVEAIKDIEPKGTTPIAYSLKEAAQDFPESRRAKNVIILLTDGIEECDGDPCAVSTSLQQKNVILKPFIIGVGISEKFKDEFDCVGRYYNAGNRKEFQEVLSVVVSQAINATTTQVKLLDIHGEATETDVNMTFFDTNQHLIRYNYYHTMDENGKPDTLNIDPVTTYDIKVHTQPPVWKKNVSIEPGSHNVIPIKTPRGRIRLKMSGENYYGEFKTLVKKDKKASCQLVNEQLMNSQHRYIVGKYDLEVLTRPKLELEDVKVNQDKETLIEIPSPGKVYVSKSQDMIGSIYHQKGNALKWICNISSDTRRELIVLQPGKYRIVARPENANKSYKTTEKKFEITSGGSTKISIN